MKKFVNSTGFILMAAPITLGWVCSVVVTAGKAYKFIITTKSGIEILWPLTLLVVFTLLWVGWFYLLQKYSSRYSTAE
jgi:hypothetical protein